MELEGRINYLEVHIEELKVENKQLEEDISQTRVENGVLRRNLHTTRKFKTGMAKSPTPVTKPLKTTSGRQAQARSVLLRDLLRIYGPCASDQSVYFGLGSPR